MIAEASRNAGTGAPLTWAEELLGRRLAPTDLLTIREAGVLLGLGYHGAHRLVENGEFGRRIGCQYLIEVWEVEEYRQRALNANKLKRDGVPRRAPKEPIITLTRRPRGRGGKSPARV